MNMAHIRQSRPDSGLGFQVKPLQNYIFPSLDSGWCGADHFVDVSNMLFLWRLPSPKRTPPPQDPTVALHLGTCGFSRGVGVSPERGTPVQGQTISLTSRPFSSSDALPPSTIAAITPRLGFGVSGSGFRV